MLLMLSADFLFKIYFFKISSRNMPSRNSIKVSNSLDPDQDLCSVSSDLDPNCLQRLSAPQMVSFHIRMDVLWVLLFV